MEKIEVDPAEVAKHFNTILVSLRMINAPNDEHHYAWVRSLLNATDELLRIGIPVCRYEHYDRAEVSLRAEKEFMRLP